MATLNINGRKVTVSDEFLKLSPEEQDKAVEEIASSIGVSPQTQQAAQPEPQPAQDQINSRIQQSFDVANKPAIIPGQILPQVTVNGRTSWDMNYGLPGMIKRAVSLPYDVLTGKAPELYGPDGLPTDAAISRASEFAALSPAGVSGSLMKGARLRPLSPAQEAAQRNIADASGFGIDLSKGQATRDFATQAFEQDALSGGKGRIAESILSNQRKAQADQVRNAASTLENNIAPARDGAAGMLQNPQERIYGAAGNIGEAIASKADKIKKAAQDQYAIAENYGGDVSPAAIGELSGSIRKSLDEFGALEGNAVAPDMPVVGRIVKRIDELSSMKNVPPEMAGDKSLGIGWQNVERIRRQINKVTGSNPDEMRVLTGIKKSMDTWLEKSVNDGLISGSPEFLNSLKSARGLWSQYQQIAKNPTQIIRKMADRSADSVEIANWIYGANKVGGKVQSASVVREIGRLVGRDTPEFQDLQRNVLSRLFNDVKQGDIKTYGRLASDMNDFLDGHGRELARSLYSAETIKQLKKFSDVLRTLTPDAATTNPSRSGQTAARRIGDATRVLAPILGWTIGDLTGLLGGLTISAGSTVAGAAKARSVVSALPPSQGRAFSGAPMNAVGRATFGLGNSSQGQVPPSTLLGRIST